MTADANHGAVASLIGAVNGWQTTNRVLWTSDRLEPSVQHKPVDVLGR